MASEMKTKTYTAFNYPLDTKPDEAIKKNKKKIIMLLSFAHVSDSRAPNNVIQHHAVI